MTDLVTRLADSPSAVTVTRVDDVAELKERIDEFEYVFVTFTETDGETELGVELDREACDFTEADFEEGTGEIHLEGTLTLNYTDVRCVADVDLETFDGKGKLEILEEAASA